MLNCQDGLCVKSGEVAMERFMLLCDSRVRTGIKMVMVMSIPIEKGSATASSGSGTFISSSLVIVPRRTEGEILSSVKRQTMGPAACAVDGEKVQINLWGTARRGPFLRLAARREGFSPFFFFLKFLPVGIWGPVALTQHPRWV